MLANILAAAILGALAGGIGGLIGALIDKFLRAGRPTRNQKWNFAAVLAVVAAIGATNSPVPRERLARLISPPTPVERFGEELIAIPQLKERLHGKSAAEAQMITQQLSAAGLSKLDDQKLIERVHLVSRLLTTADERLCAAFATGKIAPSELMDLLGKLPKEDMAHWFGIVRAAVEAEVGAVPVTPRAALTQQEIGDAMTELVKELPGDDGAQLLGRIGSLATLEPAAACATVRSLYTLVEKTQGPQTASVARALVM
jgi:hypothetical protein